jgi:probable selenium-dependent hydroxylase accessory protein YqeC
MKLTEALALRPREIISLTGAGGKTTLLFALANELAAGGAKVVTTTTTKIMRPYPHESEVLIVEKDEKLLVELAARELKFHNHITVAPAMFENGKLDSLMLHTVSDLAVLEGLDYIINEADGASRRPLKAPRPYEPVIPPETTAVIPVAGIDALNGKLEESNVFRSEVAAALLNVPLGTPLTPDLIARLFILPEGLAKGSPGNARIIPFINKVDITGGIENARKVAKAILRYNHPQIERIILGRSRDPDPVAEVIFARK